MANISQWTVYDGHLVPLANIIEEEIVNQETILRYYDALPISDRAALTASLRTTEEAILA